MAANLSPEYREAESAFKIAREPKERLECLRTMLRTIPKHKGTEHLQADIKTRIKQLTDELASPKKGGAARGGPPVTVRPEGAAQVALLGAGNVGKSTLHARLTGSNAECGPYAYTTKYPMPGMLPHEDILFQLVDLPPMSQDFMVPWIVNALQPADAALLVVDLTDPGCIEQVVSLRRLLDDKRVSLLERWVRPEPEVSEDGLLDPFRIYLPTVLVANKADLTEAPEEELAVLEELVDARFEAVAVSAETGYGLDRIGPILFDGLGVVRVYTKVPGKGRDTERPYTVRRGDTVHDVARLVHRGMAGSLRFARVWGSGQFDGQQVSRDHPVSDADVLELHW